MKLDHGRKVFLFSHGMRAFCLGMAVGAIYYAILHQPFMAHSILHAYTAHHATEYLIVLLFFWANSELLFGYLRVLRERRNMVEELIPVYTEREPCEAARAWRDRLVDRYGYLEDTDYFQRIYAALTFVSEQGVTHGLREFLDSLSNRNEDAVHARYGFSRFATAILPILGLIGTVVHFGIALSGLSMDGLESKIPSLLSGMGTAFNTTFTAMSAMATTILIRFLVERSEMENVKRIDAIVESRILFRFQANSVVNAVERTGADRLESGAAFEDWFENATHDSSVRDLPTQVFERWEQMENRREERWLKLLQTFVEIQSVQKRELMRIDEQLGEQFLVLREVITLLNGEEKLIRLQDALVQNLQLLHESQHIDSAVHELTAAIHLLTARQQQVRPRSTPNAA